MKIRRQLVTARDRTYPGVNPAAGVTVHETANPRRGANAAMHADLQSAGNVREASWHWQVDDVEAVQSFPHDVRCWHAGDGEGPGNLTRIAVEVCVNEDGDYDQALTNAAVLVRMIRKQEGIPAENVDQHHDHSGKDCPQILRRMGPSAWAAFVAATDPEGVPVFVSPAEGRVTSEWGPRERHPVTGLRGFHRGIDIAPPVRGQRGVPIYAAYGGTVRAVRTGKRNGDREQNPITGPWNTGNYVLIDGPGGGSEWYGHLETIVVAAGDRVQAGTYLGTMGDSGNVSGVHLHFECWNNRHQGGGLKGGNTRDPRVDFKAHGITPGSAPVLPKNPTSPFPTPDKTTPNPLEDWLDMASIDEVRAVVREELQRKLQSDVANIKVAVGRLDVGQGNTLPGELGKIRDAVEKTKVAVGRLDPGQGRVLDEVLTKAITDAVAQIPTSSGQAVDVERIVTTAVAAARDDIANRLTQED